MDNTRDEKILIESCLEGTHLEGGFGFAFRYILEMPDLSIEAKLLAMYYGLFFKSETSECNCWSSKDTICTTLRIRHPEYYAARDSLQVRDLLKIESNRKKNVNNHMCQDTTMVSLQMRPLELISEDPKSTLLTKHYGLFPRALFFDTSIKKIDKVAAGLFYSLIGSNLTSYKASKYKIRTCLSNAKGTMTEYQLSQVQKRLSDYFDFRAGETSDSIIISIKNEIFKGKNNYSSGNEVSEKNVPSENVDNLVYQQKNVPSENVPAENVPSENVPPIISISHNYINQNVNQYQIFNPPRAREEAEDKRADTDSSWELNLEERKRAGEFIARDEVETIAVYDGWTDDKKFDRLARINHILDTLGQIAANEPDLEEHALAVNMAAVISHRALKQDQIRNIYSYIRQLIINDKEHNAYVEAPVMKTNGLTAYLDGYRRSDHGIHQRDLYEHEDNNYDSFDKKKFAELISSYLIEFSRLPLREITATYQARKAFSEMLLNDLNEEYAKGLLRMAPYSLYEQAVKLYLDAWVEEILPKREVNLEGSPYLTEYTMRNLAKISQSYRGEFRTRTALMVRCLSLFIQRKQFGEEEILSPQRYMTALIISEVYHEAEAPEIWDKKVDPENVKPVWLEKANRSQKNRLNERESFSEAEVARAKEDAGYYDYGRARYHNRDDFNRLDQMIRDAASGLGI